MNSQMEEGRAVELLAHALPSQHLHVLTSQGTLEPLIWTSMEVLLHWYD